jgi:hypothetical protein
MPSSRLSSRLILAILPLATALHAADPTPPTALPEMTVEGKADSLIGIAPSASKGQTSAAELATRPFLRRGELLEVVPGMTVTQHAGGGKANQYFLRGINLDHGTDFAISIDGLPVNLRTHAHGQGYADLNIVIPELVESIDYRKGPYFADLGDLSAAGAARFQLTDSLPSGIASLSLGEYGWYRGLLADSISLTTPSNPSAPSSTLTYGLEFNAYDGPWILPENARRWNGLLRWVSSDATDRFALTAMGYDGRWTSSDQIPQRAINQNLVDRFGNLDPSNGGTSSRYSLLADWSRKTDDRGQWHADAFLSRYDLQLFSNFTYFLDDPVNGDQFEQSESRWLAGASLRREWLFPFASASSDSSLTAGVDSRTDWIDDIGLYKTSARQRLSTTRRDDVTESSAGLFVNADLHFSDWFRLQPGLRADAFLFRTSGPVAANAGSDSAALVSPKLSAIFGPWHQTESYLNAGWGFHSNDARGVLTTIDPVSGSSVLPVDPLVRIFGAELGIRSEALTNWVHSASLWYLHSDSELVYIGDAGTNEAGPSSRRYGIELASYWRPSPALMLDSEFTVSHAAFSDGSDVPNNVPLTWNGGITVGHGDGFFGSLRARAFARRPLEESGRVKSRASLLLNARAGFRRKSWELAVDCLNLLGRNDNDIEYFYDSRLASEPAPVSDRHIHPTEPRMFRVSLTKTW